LVRLALLKHQVQLCGRGSVLEQPPLGQCCPPDRPRIW
jgi:hypothetical protein